MPNDTVAAGDTIGDTIADCVQDDASKIVTAPVSEPMAALQQQVARLSALVEAQQAQIEQLLDARDSTKSAKAALRRERRATTSSRRALLKWGGAAAAAATVAMVASEGQRAHAEPLNSGSNLVLGHTNLAENSTTVQLDTTTTPGIVFFAADNGTSTPSSPQYPAAIGGYATGVASIVHGVYGYTTSSAGSGVVGWAPGASGGGGVSAGVGVSAYTSDTINNNPALQAYNQGSGNGAYIQGANNQVGVNGSIIGGASGKGVYGYATGTSSSGVTGASDSGFGVSGFSTTGIDLSASGSGRFYQLPTLGHSGPPTSGFYFQGEQLRDQDGEMWICVAGSGADSGQWAKVAHGIVGGTSGGAINFLAKPLRLLDTRIGFPGYVNSTGAYAGGSTHTLQVTGDNYQGETVPFGVGMFGKVTAVAGNAGGFIAILPHGVAFTGTANVPFGPNQTVANSFATALSLTGSAQPGAIDIYVGANSTDVVIDIFAIFS